MNEWSRQAHALLRVRRRELRSAPTARRRDSRVPARSNAEIDHRRGVERQHLAEHQAADDRDAQRPAQLRTHAGAHRQRHGAQQGRHRGHHDRPEAQQARLVNRLVRSLALRCRSASRAKSIIMMAFFLTMPISRMMPIKRDHAQIGMAEQQRQQRAHAGRRQRREIVIG